MKLDRLLSKLIIALSVLLNVALGSAVLSSIPAQAAACDANLTLQSGINCAAPAGVSGKGLFSDPNGSLFQSITNTLIFVIGAISVLMIIIGALRYTLSAGNASSVEGAKNTIMYAIIGLVIAILAFAIVNFVLKRIQ